MAHRKTLLVCIHDVCPQQTKDILTILESLEPIVGTTVTAAVIPKPFGKSWETSDQFLIASLKERTEEILLHGFTHRKKACFNPLSMLINKADEFSNLSIRDTAQRICNSQQTLKDIFGQPADGFVAPGWLFGNVTTQLLEQHGIKYAVGLKSMTYSTGLRLRLATWSWDCGVIGLAGYAGEIVGTALYLRKNAIPCIVLHPNDVPRGFLPRILSRIRYFLDGGFNPVLFRDLWPSKRMVL